MEPIDRYAVHFPICRKAFLFFAINTGYKFPDVTVDQTQKQKCLQRKVKSKYNARFLSQFMYRFFFLLCSNAKHSLKHKWEIINFIFTRRGTYAIKFRFGF